MVAFRFSVFCFLVLLFGCGKNKSKNENYQEPIQEIKPLLVEKKKDSFPKPEPKPEFKREPKPEPLVEKPIVVTKEEKSKGGILNVKVGEGFEYGNLLITVIDVLKEEEIIAKNKAIFDVRNPDKISQFISAPVWLKFENISSGKIDSSPGLANGITTLEDEFENKLPMLNQSNWEFIIPGQTPDTGWRIDPGNISYYAIYFQRMPKTSNKFILTMRLRGKTVRCEGVLGEATRLKNQKNERELKVAEEKKERELKAAEEKEKQQRIVMEASRKKDLESKNLPYYPLPYTKIKEARGEGLLLKADQWYERLVEAVSLSDSNGAKEAFDNLRLLKDEGVPFLMDFLVRQTTSQGRELALVNLYSCNIHPNDLPKIIACLNKSKNQISTRVIALNLLAKSGNAKPYFDKIQPMTVDLLINKNVKDSVKEYLDKIKN